MCRTLARCGAQSEPWTPARIVVRLQGGEHIVGKLDQHVLRHSRVRNGFELHAHVGLWLEPKELLALVALDPVIVRVVGTPAIRHDGAKIIDGAPAWLAVFVDQHGATCAVRDLDELKADSTNTIDRAVIRAAR